MGKSDTDEPNEWGELIAKFRMEQAAGDATIGEKDHEIHSGHFMISSLDEEGETETENQPGYDFSEAQQETANTYHFGENIAVEIDTSLTSLFQCMTLAYRLVFSLKHISWSSKKLGRRTFKPFFRYPSRRLQTRDPLLEALVKILELKIQEIF